MVLSHRGFHVVNVAFCFLFLGCHRPQTFGPPHQQNQSNPATLFARKEAWPSPKPSTSYAAAEAKHPFRLCLGPVHRNPWQGALALGPRGSFVDPLPFIFGSPMRHLMRAPAPPPSLNQNDWVRSCFDLWGGRERNCSSSESTGILKLHAPLPGAIFGCRRKKIDHTSLHTALCSGVDNAF